MKYLDTVFNTVVILACSKLLFVVLKGSIRNSQALGLHSRSITSCKNFVGRSDNNIFNYAPIANVMSPIDIQVTQTTLVPGSVSDSDADIVKCP